MSVTGLGLEPRSPDSLSSLGFTNNENVSGAHQKIFLKLLSMVPQNHKMLSKNTLT